MNTRPRKGINFIPFDMVNTNLSRHPIMESLRAMIKRCYNPNDPNYKNYGARGITIWEGWYNPNSVDNLEGIINFFDWAFKEGKWRPGYSIERLDVNGPYAPWNCIFVSPRDQANNKRNTVYYEYDNNSMSYGNWAYAFGYDVAEFKNNLNKAHGDIDAVMQKDPTYGFGQMYHNNQPVMTNAIYYSIGTKIIPQNQYNDFFMMPALFNVNENGVTMNSIINWDTDYMDPMNYHIEYDIYGNVKFPQRLGDFILLGYDGYYVRPSGGRSIKVLCQCIRCGNIISKVLDDTARGKWYCYNCI